ncbi:MAG: nucleoside transporter C-terminal domain-containing protein [Polyangiaceae bacterium]
MTADAGRILFGLFGLTALISAAWLASEDRRAVDWREIPKGVALQWLLAGFVLKVSIGRLFFDAIASAFVRLTDFVSVGSQFVFGSLVDPTKFGFVFALQVLPTVVFFSSLTNVLYHFGVMQRVVAAMAWAIGKVMKVSGAEATVVCASLFLGSTEAPLTIRPYVEGMTESEMMTMMVAGMAHISGALMAAYVGLLGGDDPEQRQFFAKHLLTASVMAAPATLILAKILVPERGRPSTSGQVAIHVGGETSNAIDAAATGAADGLRLALNIGAMLLAFIALIALVNAPLHWLGLVPWGAGGGSIDGWLSSMAGHRVELSLQTAFGWVLAPVAWLIGVSWNDAATVGRLIGEKIVINEFVAYVDLSQHLGVLTRHSQIISTYALAGFANFASIAIQIGGIGGLAPSRRKDVARLGLRAVLGGGLATLMTATIAGVLSQL